MKVIFRKAMILAIAVCLCAFLSVGAEAAPYVGPAIGPVTASVATADDSRGLSVRSGPSDAAPVMGVLAVGTRVINHPRFENGWVMLQSPMNGGWVRLDSLQAIRGVATVIDIDRPETCLRIRNGPGVDYDVMGCARMGEKLGLTGFWSENNWVEIDGPVPGWVSAAQIRTNINVVVRSAPAPITTVISETVVPVPYRVRRTYPVYYDYPYRYGGFRYNSPGVGVAVGPRGGVGVRVGPVGVGVGPGGGVDVGAGGVRVRVR